MSKKLNKKGKMSHCTRRENIMHVHKNGLKVTEPKRKTNIKSPK